MTLMTKVELTQRIQEILSDSQRTREVVVAACNALMSMQSIQADPKAKDSEAVLAGTSILNAALFGSGKLS